MTPDQLLAAANAATQASAGATDFEGDETPVVAVNRPLLEAYNAMWDASRSLEVGEPGAALPPMRVALAAIQRARNAERLYLRGKAPVVIVDITRCGSPASATTRRRRRDVPRAALDSSSERRAERFDAALSALASNPSAAIDSLLALRVDALDERAARSPPRSPPRSMRCAPGTTPPTRSCARGASPPAPSSRASTSPRGCGMVGAW